MDGPIKSVLREELNNSISMEKKYREEINKLPSGCISKKKINNHDYYYLVKRNGKKVEFSYIGKASDKYIKKIVKEHLDKKKKRDKYKKLLSQSKKQIKFLRSCLRGSEPI